MNLDLSEEQEMLQRIARDFLANECPKELVRGMEEDEKGYSPELWRKMADLGWMGLVLPDEYGGMGGSFLDMAILLEEMGRALVPGPFLSTVLGAFTILRDGSEEQKGDILPQVAQGEAILAIAVTEPFARFDARGISLQAAADRDEFVLSGTKLFISDAHVADWLLVAARTREGATPEEGITAFLVDGKSAGIACTPLITIAGDKQFEVVFDKVRVPARNVLGEVDRGWEMVERLLELGAVGKAAEMVGGTQQVLEMTNAYVKERVQYERPIGVHQAIQHALAEVFIQVNLGRSLVYEAAWKVDEGLLAGVEAAMAKGWMSDTYRQATNSGVRLHGGIGTSLDHDMGLYYRRAKAAELAFGDADFQREMVAERLGF